MAAGKPMNNDRYFTLLFFVCFAIASVHNAHNMSENLNAVCAISWTLLALACLLASIFKKDDQ